jgi:hypothetical protein
VPEATFRDPAGYLSFAYPSVFPNKRDGGWRMLYQTFLPDPENPAVCKHILHTVADSDDGVVWEIPDLTEKVPVSDRLLPNQVETVPPERVGEWGPCYFDAREPDPDRRIKGFVCKGHGPGTGIKDSWIVTSPDGMTWEQHPELLWHPYGSDPAVCAFWNRYRGSYVLMIRPNNGDRRVAVIETRDWRQFSKVELALAADALDPDLAEIYGMPTFPYGDMFVGLLWLYRVPPVSKQHGKFIGGKIDCQLAYSYDGWHFQRGLRDSLIPNAAPGEPGSGCILPSSMTDCGDEIRFYSCVTRSEHAIFDPQVGPAGSAVLMHRLRPDGFVYLESNGGEAALATRALLVDGPELTLNVAAPDGEVAVAITDADGNAIPGYDFDDAVPARVDDLAWQPLWKGGAQFDGLQGRAVRLHLRLSSGRLYAISGDFRKLTAKEGMRYMRFGTPPDPKNWG